MHLRPHHILCIQKFTGCGYNNRFTAHMQSIVSELRRIPETPVTLMQGCDELCKMCPNNRNGSCTSLEKVAALDNAVLIACNRFYGDNAPWARLAAKAREQIFETEKFTKICTHCQWFELCRNTEVPYE